MADEFGVTPNHISNVAYGLKKPSKALAEAIELFTGGDVTRQELRPHDWRDFWPESGDRRNSGDRRRRERRTGSRRKEDLENS